MTREWETNFEPGRRVGQASVCEWGSDSFLLLTRGSWAGRRASVVGSKLLDVGTCLRGIRALWDCWLGGWLEEAEGSSQLNGWQAARELLGVTRGVQRVHG